MKRCFIRFVGLVLALLLLAGLTSTVHATTDMAGQLKQILRGEEGLNLSALYDVPIKMSNYGAVASNSRRLDTLNDLVLSAVTTAIAALKPNADMELTLQTNLSWQAVGALYRNFSKEELTALLIDKLIVRYTVRGKDASLCVSYPSFMELAASGDADASFAAMMDFGYLNTRYNEKGKAIGYVQPFVSRADLCDMTYPLETRYIRALKPCWYKPRTHGLRLHMGTDIRADRLSPILSCTDGVVEYAGYASTPGNYVCVLGDDGYRYLYFHIENGATYVTVGQRVARGDTLAGVGNTGNSVANHLHLSIITPSLTFIDPYLVLRDMLRLQGTLAALPERGDEAAAAEQLVQ